MKNLKQYLQDSLVESHLAGIFLTLAEAVKKIAVAIETADTTKAGTINSFGEEQIGLDILANRIINDELRGNSDVGLVASEEMEGEEKFSDGEFAVCHDPLDGSSLADVNLSVGSIFGIYKAKSFIGLRGVDQLGSLIAVYGPRTTLIFTAKNGVHEFYLNRDGDFILSRENLKVSEGKMFAPGNLRACSVREDYLNLMNFWCQNQYTLRYSGGMVPDINQILIKGKGIFAYPGYGDEPDGKLRILFECAPMALLITEAGGKASDGKIDLLQKEISSLTQRTQIFIGSTMEVQRCKEYLASEL